MTTVRALPENKVNHYTLRVGDGKNFVNSSGRCIWAIRSSNKSFLENVKKGDILWFIRNKQVEDINTGKVIAVASFSSSNDRISGELINTYTNEELMWDDVGGHCGSEIHYSGLYNLTDKNVFTGQKGRTTVCNYDNFKEPLLIQLRREYDYICKYSNTPRKM
jgi:hypothetical protein